MKEMENQSAQGGGKKQGTRLKYHQDYPADFKFDYKDPNTLWRFVMDGGKIVPSRIRKMSQAQQRDVTRAIKIARTLSLLPTSGFDFDNMHDPEHVSPVPFTY